VDMEEAGVRDQELLCLLLHNFVLSTVFQNKLQPTEL
jgi:hypothetical protein